MAVATCLAVAGVALSACANAQGAPETQPTVAVDYSDGDRLRIPFGAVVEIEKVEKKEIQVEYCLSGAILRGNKRGNECLPVDIPRAKFADATGKKFPMKGNTAIIRKETSATVDL